MPSPSATHHLQPYFLGYTTSPKKSLQCNKLHLFRHPPIIFKLNSIESDIPLPPRSPDRLRPPMSIVIFIPYRQSHHLSVCHPSSLLPRPCPSYFSLALPKDGNFILKNCDLVIHCFSFLSSPPGSFTSVFSVPSSCISTSTFLLLLLILLLYLCT